MLIFEEKHYFISVKISLRTTNRKEKFYGTDRKKKAEAEHISQSNAQKRREILSEVEKYN